MSLGNHCYVEELLLPVRLQLLRERLLGSDGHQVSRVEPALIGQDEAAEEADLGAHQRQHIEKFGRDTQLTATRSSGR
jgi:hypothetical protein